MTEFQIKRIKTNADHEAALREIEAFCDGAEGSADGKWFDVLVKLVENYEKKCWPMVT